MLTAEEELFCIKYELNALANLLVRNEAERWVKGFLHPKYEHEHLLRYKYASRFVKDKTVLDIACGTGYGSFMLAEEGEAREVVGVDLDSEAIRYASLRYSHPHVNRYHGNARTFKGDKLYDIIISFETIEHIEDYKGFLNNLYSNLAEDGLLILSTPLQKRTVLAPQHNPYHVIEWSYEDFISLVEPDFTVLNVKFQNILVKGKYPAYNLKNRLLNKLGIKNYTKTPDQFYKGLSEKSQIDITEIDSGYIIVELQKR